MSTLRMLVDKQTRLRYAMDDAMYVRQYSLWRSLKAQKVELDKHINELRRYT